MIFKTIIVFTCILLIYSCMTREPRYELCTIVAPDKTYKVIERDSYYIRHYDGALQFYSDNKKVSLTNYSMSCVPYKKEINNE